MDLNDILKLIEKLRYIPNFRLNQDDKVYILRIFAEMLEKRED